jgi:sigma-E factor negative regulatory protein RseC
VLEEPARVVVAAERFVVVETLRRSTCESCSAHKGCGTATLGKVLGRRRTSVRALSDIDVRAGDQVVIAIAEGAFLRGSLATYLMPLLLMIVGAFLGQQLSFVLSLQGEGLTILLGGVGLGLGFGCLLLFSRSIRRDGRYQPMVLRRVARTSGHT